jgi:hypothetical protein
VRIAEHSAAPNDPEGRGPAGRPRPLASTNGMHFSGHIRVSRSASETRKPPTSGDFAVRPERFELPTFGSVAGNVSATVCQAFPPRDVKSPVFIGVSGRFRASLQCAAMVQTQAVSQVETQANVKRSTFGSVSERSARDRQRTMTS